MGWISPTGHNDPDTAWNDEAQSYDGNTGTGATCPNIASNSWGSHLELTHSELKCSAIRFNAYYVSGEIEQIDLDVYYGGAWHDLYQGTFADGTWEVKETGSSESVTKARARFYNEHDSIAQTAILYELEFWQVDEKQSSDQGSGSESLSSQAAIGSSESGVGVEALGSRSLVLIESRYGKCLSFKSALSNYVNLGNPASLNPTAAISVEAWVRARTSPPAAYVIFYSEEDYTNKRGVRLRLQYNTWNTWKIMFDLGNGTTYLSISGLTGTPVNTLRHILATWDGTTVKVYLDGRPDATPVAFSGPIVYVNGKNYIGRDGGGAGYHDGIIDEVRVYSRALSDDEASEHSKGIFRDETGLVGLWHMDEGSGNVVGDSSGLGNDGTRYGATWVGSPIPITGVGVDTASLLAELAEVSRLFEHYNTGDDCLTDVGGVTWWAQTFTVAAPHQVSKVRLKMYRSGTPNTGYIGIKATDGNGHPIGADLCSGSFDGNSLTTDSAGAWYDVELGQGTDLPAGKYAIVMRVPNPDGTSRVRWLGDCSSPTYTGGELLYSTDSGETWNLAGTGEDTMFEVWGKLPSPQFGAGDDLSSLLAELTKAETGAGIDIATICSFFTSADGGAALETLVTLLTLVSTTEAGSAVDRLKAKIELSSKGGDMKLPPDGQISLPSRKVGI
ncbi:LamG domain-containing protein [Chloroflexota bacterium]